MTLSLVHAKKEKKRGIPSAASMLYAYANDDEVLKGLKHVILKKKIRPNDTSFRGEKKIVIFTTAQMKSFEELGNFATQDGT